LDRTDRLGPQLKKQFGGECIANEKYTLAQANQVIEDGEADAVAFGRLFIANPNLPARLTSNALLNVPDGSTFFAPGSHG
jgi:2,4-dienoyl-CoA reductase-like NADH-dependent reductase (Old Yellow Enzyme family)